MDPSCIDCGEPMTCTICEGCDAHCIERDAIRCALLVVKEAESYEPPRHQAAIEQLASALRARKGFTEEEAATAAEALAAVVR
jgi:hypothetical protein